MKEANNFILNLYINKKITRAFASELMGVTPTSLSQVKYKLLRKDK